MVELSTLTATYDFRYCYADPMSDDHNREMEMILIAGPYRPGTNDVPELMAANVKVMESFALSIFRAGHIPVLGEWFALPLAQLGGSLRAGDDVFNEVFHPIAVRLLRKCDGVLRIGGPSAGADEMVRVGRQLGLKIYSRIQEIPGCEGSS